MKTVINKTIFFTALVITALLSGYFMYQSYLAYKSYQIAQNADTYISYIKESNEVLKKIEHECSSSALYLGKNGKIDFSRVEKSRNNTDHTLKGIEKFILDNPKFLSDLQYVRSRVDVVSSDYRDILISYYQDEISNAILKEIKERTEALSLGLSNLKKELYAYNNFIVYRNSMAKERSFITYILSSSKKMDTQDLLLWEEMLAKEKFPTSTEIQENLQLQNFSKFDSDLRVYIARGITTGNYQISSQKWLEKANQKRDRVIQSEEKLYNHIQSQLTNETSYPKALLYNSAFALFTLLSFFTLIRSQKTQSNKRETNQDIVRKREVYDTSNKEIIHKRRMSDTPKNNSLFDEVQYQGVQQRSTDIPLTNTAQVKRPNIPEDESIRAFNPMEEFAHIINRFAAKTAKRDIGFKYKLDYTLPTYCIGDIDKIYEALNYLLDYTIQSSNSRSFLTLNIDNIAQTKLESAISFSLKQSNSHFTKEEIKEIQNARYNNIYKKKARAVKLNKTKENLRKVSKSISSINGNFQIKSDSKNETDFIVTVNLKRG